MSLYRSQNEEIDYTGYVQCLSRFRGFHQGRKFRHAGSFEAYFALPGVDYAAIVGSLYGTSSKRVPLLLKALAGGRALPKA